MDVICFSEAWLSPEQQINADILPVDKAVVFRLDREEVTGMEDVSHGGVMMLVNPNLKPKRIAIKLDRMEMLAVTIFTGTIGFNIVTVYRQPSGLTIEEFTSKF